MQPVEKPFTTAPLSTLTSAPLINNNKQVTVNAALRPQMTHQPRRNLRGGPKQVRVQRQNHQPLLNLLLKHPLQLQVPVGKQIPFLSLLALFQALTKILLRCTDNTSHKSVPDLAAVTDFKTRIISASPPSTQPPFANNWAGSLSISPPSLKSTSPLVLFCVIQKLGPYSTITRLLTIIWCWNNGSWSQSKMI